jgi:hypothetical protein
LLQRRIRAIEFDIVKTETLSFQESAQPAVRDAACANGWTVGTHVDIASVLPATGLGTDTAGLIRRLESTTFLVGTGVETEKGLSFAHGDLIVTQIAAPGRVACSGAVCLVR